MTTDNNRFQVLAVDDDPAVHKSIKVIFDGEYEFSFASNASEALSLLDKRDIQLAILDLGLPDMSGIELLKKIKEINSDIEIIVLTGDTSLRNGIDAMKAGAYDYLVKPFDVDQITMVVKNALEKASLIEEVRYHRVIDDEKKREIVGESNKIKDVFEMINKLVNNDATVLIMGESGTGKELVARAIHNGGYRKDRPFIPVNCGAIPPELIESELFGHEKGAFTSASYKRIGKFELAHRGTIFLDEIGTLPLNLQVKLLRVLQERSIERIGGMRQIPINVRVIAATNVDLNELVKRGEFREDLYYRLNIVPLSIPPLRERKEDIPLLVEHFFNLYRKKYHRIIKNISPDVMGYFVNYEWKGNVRELENVIQCLLIISERKDITIGDLPADIISKKVPDNAGLNNGLQLEEALTRFEREYINKALIKSGNNRQEAAQILGVHRNTLLNRMRVLGMKEELE
ncbi:MAG: sigma-54-dependent Fis family transcriptional regulator [Planctomycetes bacterium]|nr:sigma-54-dependent Fis family transcriptional regulator [Planctomycetota bacterium]